MSRFGRGEVGPRLAALAGRFDDLELNAAKLDHVAELERLRLPGQDPLAVDEGPAGALQVAEGQPHLGAVERGVTARHLPGRAFPFLIRQVDPRPSPGALPSTTSPIPSAKTRPGSRPRTTCKLQPLPFAFGSMRYP